MTDVHSCSYFCLRPDCVLQGWDELRAALQQAEQVDKWLTDDLPKVDKEQAEPVPSRPKKRDREAMTLALNTLERSAIRLTQGDFVLPAIDALHAALAQQAEPVADAVRGECRLWDSQWTNIVNHANCYIDWSKEDAIRHAVKMTETYIARNVERNHFPPARQAEPVVDRAQAQSADDNVISRAAASVVSAWSERYKGLRDFDPADRIVVGQAINALHAALSQQAEPHKPATDATDGKFMSQADGNVSY